LEGLPPELHKVCRDVFLDCPQFESYERLRLFCKGLEPLYFLYFELKNAESLSALFELNLPILLERKHKQYGWIFPIFVDALKPPDENDDRRSRLNDLYAKIKAHQEQHRSEERTSTYTFDDNRRLFKSLLQIDFEEQQEEVTNALKLQQSLKRAAAFLIHGEEKFGQEILVHRLSQLPELRNGRRIKIKMARMDDVSDLWNAVAAELTGGSNQVSYLSPDQVMALVIECLKTQHLIFIFTEVHRSCIGFMPELIEQFWQPMVDIVNLKETYLVMFLVDNKGKTCKSGMPLAWQVCQPEYPKVPLHLPPTTRFLHKKISQWLQMAVAAEIVPESLSVETLLNESQGGVPELVYQRICYHCDCSWEGGLAQWLIQ
jgi:hypothetical protein